MLTSDEEIIYVLEKVDSNKSDSDSRNDNEETNVLKLTEDDKLLASAFEKQDVAFVFEDTNGRNEKLYGNKDQLSKVSPVFEAMFSSNFSESTSAEVPLPGKKMSTFVHFLRLALPGHVDEITDTIAHDVLPLVREYETDDLKHRIDAFLSEEVNYDGDTILSSRLIANIREAEEFKLMKYLSVCILVASRRKYKNLMCDWNYNAISKETQLQIAHKRLQTIDDIFEQNMCYQSQIGAGFCSVDRGARQGDWRDWKYEYLNNDRVPKGHTVSSRMREFLDKAKGHFETYMK